MCSQNAANAISGVTGDSPTQEIRPPLKRGAIFLAYSPLPPDDSPRNIAPL
jgi:hypothetical protein